MRKLFNAIDTILSFSLFYKLLKYKIKYRGINMHPSVKIIDKGGNFTYAIKNAIGDRGMLILAEKSNISLGKNVWLGQDVLVEPLDGCSITIGNGSSIQDRCRLIGDIQIGKNVLLAPNIFISSGNHFFDLIPHLPIRIQDAIVNNNRAKYSDSRSRKVVIEDDCWIGTNVVISRGVKIGKGVIVGANAIVTKDVEPYTVIGGIPAKKMKERFCFIPPPTIYAINPQHLPYFYAGFNMEGYKVGMEDLTNVKLYVDVTFTVSLKSESVNKTVYIVLENSGPIDNVQIWFGNYYKDLVPGKERYEFYMNENNKYMYTFELRTTSKQIDMVENQYIYAIEAGIA